MGQTGSIDISSVGSIGSIIPAVKMETTSTIQHGGTGIAQRDFSTAAGSELAGFPTIMFNQNLQINFKGSLAGADKLVFWISDDGPAGRAFPGQQTTITGHNIPTAHTGWYPDWITYANYLTGSWRCITSSYNYKSYSAETGYYSGWSAGLWIRYA
jgi:hypothetical protein